MPAQSSQVRFWYECLWDAVELVDLRSGEIRNRAINAWLLGETLAGLRCIAHPRVQKLVERLTEQSDELLTFLDSLVPALETWQAHLAQHFPDPAWAAFFQATVARTWRPEHALAMDTAPSLKPLPKPDRSWTSSYLPIPSPNVWRKICSTCWRALFAPVVLPRPSTVSCAPSWRAAVNVPTRPAASCSSTCLPCGSTYTNSNADLAQAKGLTN